MYLIITAIVIAVVSGIVFYLYEKGYFTKKREVVVKESENIEKEEIKTKTVIKESKVIDENEIEISNLDYDFDEKEYLKLCDKEVTFILDSTEESSLEINLEESLLDTPLDKKSLLNYSF